MTGNPGYFNLLLASFVEVVEGIIIPYLNETKVMNEEKT